MIDLDLWEQFKNPTKFNVLEEETYVNRLGYPITVEDKPIFGVKASSDDSNALLSWRTYDKAD